MLLKIHTTYFDAGRRLGEFILSICHLRHALLPSFQALGVVWLLCEEQIKRKRTADALIETFTSLSTIKLDNG